jgi:hypothetical protein
MCLVFSVFLFLLAPSKAHSTAADESFERLVRPLLAAKCYACHNQGNLGKGGLSLSSREGILTGGGRGPAAIPGKPNESILLAAVKRVGELKMPPDSPLSKSEVQILEEWINADFPWPKSPTDGQESSAKELWVLNPPVDPSWLGVQTSESDSNGIDSLLSARREEVGLMPNPPADRFTWIRRASFDLLGLPPSKEESLAFAADLRHDARDRWVDRSLASPQYAERWARHWLDLVRYAETNGHEEDSVKANAFRYRNYVIDALNIDLPYDQFVREHIAGDQLVPPRMSRDGSRQESPLGSGFWWLGEMMHLPFDPVELQRVTANEIEGQVDTFGKAFLGLTIACARCHDHKFDPITMDDYYAIAGTLASSTNRQVCVESSEAFSRSEILHQRIEAIDAEIQSILCTSIAQSIASKERRAQSKKTTSRIVEAMRTNGVAGGLAAGPSDSEGLVGNPWRQILSPQTGLNDPFVFALCRISSSSEATIGRRLESMLARIKERNAEFNFSVRPHQIFSDFEDSDFGGWKASGHAFGSGPVGRGIGTFQGAIGNQYVSSARGGTKQTGRLVSPTFRSNDHERYLCFLLAGGSYPRQTCVNLILHSQACPQNMPFWSVVGDGTHHFVFRYIDLGFYEDMDLFLEIVDEHSGDMGYIAADHFFFSSRLPSEDQIILNQVVIDALRGARSIEDVAARYSGLITQVLDRIEQGATNDPDPHWNSLIDWIRGPDSPLLTQEQWVDRLPTEDRSRIRQLQQERREIVERLPTSVLAMVSADRPKVFNARRQISADPTELGDEVRRGHPPRLLSLGRNGTPDGSGRLDLAEWTSDPRNPLTARVYVNRLWGHHFGRGLVATPDNFGKLGEACSHPELLDFLACRLIESNWSTKAMHRLMVTSSAYGLSSSEKGQGSQFDPENRFLHRMPIRRLEAECIRDATLMAADCLDVRLVETSCKLDVPDPFMIQPVQTPGVRSTDRCRSIYLQVMRNHTPTLMSAFDFPQLSQTAGKRTSFSVPRQSLELLNGEFSSTIAREWGERLAADPKSIGAKIDDVFWSALNRAPRDQEVASARRLLEDQTKMYLGVGSSSEADQRAWGDLCHVILNLSEFIFVR